MINYRFPIKSSQDGVTLLVATLVMATISLIALTVSAFTIQEIRASRAVVATEPAIFAAETAGEQGVWALKRGGTIASCPAQTQTMLGSSALVNYCKNYGSATLELSGEPVVFYLYNPNDINGDTDLSEFPITSLTIDHTAGSFQVNIDVIRLDGTSVASTSVSPGNTQVINIPAVSADTEGRMQVTLTAGGNSTVEADTNLGMPDFPVVDAMGCSSRGTIASCTAAGQEIYTRRVQVTVPQ